MSPLVGSLFAHEPSVSFAEDLEQSLASEAQAVIGGVPDGICLDAEGAVWYGDVHVDGVLQREMRLGFIA